MLLDFFHLFEFYTVIACVLILCLIVFDEAYVFNMFNYDEVFN